MPYLSLLILVFLIAVGAYAYEANRKAKRNAEPTPVSASSWAGKYTGRIDPPDHDERIRLRGLGLAHQGKVATGDDAIDNAATGGGGVDGGMYFEGAFAFEVDENNYVVKGKGSFIIFGSPFAITGGVINADGTFTFAAEGLPLYGKVVDGVISGRVTGGPGEEFVYGNMVGAYERGGKL